MQKKNEESLITRLAREREKEEREAKWKAPSNKAKSSQGDGVLKNPSKVLSDVLHQEKKQAKSKSVETTEETDDMPSVYCAGRKSFGNFNTQIEKLNRQVKAEYQVLAKVMENAAISDAELAAAMGKKWSPKDVVESELEVAKLKSVKVGSKRSHSESERKSDTSTKRVAKGDSKAQ